MQNEKEEAEIILSRKRWMYRRRIAISAFVVVVTVLFLTLFSWVTVDGDDANLVEYIVGGMILIVLGYQGISTVDDIASKWSRSRSRTRTRQSPIDRYDSDRPQEDDISLADNPNNNDGGEG